MMRLSIQRGMYAYAYSPSASRVKLAHAHLELEQEWSVCPAGQAESGPGSMAGEKRPGTISLLMALDKLISSHTAGRGE